MVVIRLSRVGATNNPKYKIAVADSRKSPKTRFIDQIGFYDPLSKDKKVVIDHETYDLWLKRGAQPSQTVKNLVSKINQKRSTK